MQMAKKKQPVDQLLFLCIAQRPHRHWLQTAYFAAGVVLA